VRKPIKFQELAADHSRTRFRFRYIPRLYEIGTPICLLLLSLCCIRKPFSYV